MKIPIFRLSIDLIRIKSKNKKNHNLVIIGGEND